MTKLFTVLSSSRFWVGVIGAAAVIYTSLTGTEVTPEQLASMQTTVMGIVAIVAALIGADTYRKLGS